MKTGLFALFLLCLISLMAQSPAPDVQALRLWVAENPIDSSARLNLAYQLMLVSQTDEALKHYETLLKQDPQNASAAEGILWALQSQHHFRESITRSEEFLRSFPLNASLHNYTAYGLSQLNLHLASRQHYAAAEELAIDATHRDNANLGLTWEYLFLKNYPAAKSALAQLKDDADPLAQSLIGKTNLQIAVGAGTDYQAKHSGNLSAALQKAEWSLKLSAEELIIDGSRFREKYGFAAGWQSPLAFLEASASRLSGKDERVYPATLIGLSIKPIFYLSKLQLTPSLSGAYSHFERFDVQQADLGLQVTSDIFSAGYSFSKVYQDNEALLSDSEKQLHSFTLGARIAPQIWLSAYLYEGKQAWWINPYGAIYDDFEASNRAYAFSLSSPLGTRMGIMLYQQIGVQDHETQQSSFVTLSYHI